MQEQSSKKESKLDTTCKMSFLFGFFAGMALLSLIIFIGVFIMILGNYKTLSAAGDNDASEKSLVTTDPAEEQPANTAKPVIPIKDTEYVKGNKEAKLEIIEYSDFECPFCLKHYKTMKEVYDLYKDKAKFVFRNFPLSFHAEAQKAAEAAECAGEQGKFWEMHDAIFEANEAGVMSVEKWKENAKNLGLDQKKFDECINSGKYADKIAKDMSEGVESGIEGTPATFINGVLLKGAYPLDSIKAMIEEALQN